MGSMKNSPTKVPFVGASNIITPMRPNENLVSDNGSPKMMRTSDGNSWYSDKSGHVASSANASNIDILAVGKSRHLTGIEQIKEHREE